MEPDETPSTSLWDSKIKNLNFKKVVRLLSIVILVAAIPATVFIAQQQQNTRQEASYSGGCKTLSMSEAGTGSIGPDSDFIWRPQLSCTMNCSRNLDCPGNTEQPDKINPNTSGWCYGFDRQPNGATTNRCLLLVYTGSNTPPTAVPTQPPFSGGLNVNANPSVLNQNAAATVDLTGGCACGTNIDIDTHGGLNCTSHTLVFSGCSSGPPGTTFDWRWTCTAAGSPGNYTVSGTGGNGSCSAQNSYAILAPTATPIPTQPPPPPTPTPTSTPTPTPTGAPTPTSTPTPTPTSTPVPGGTTVGLSLTLVGIGAGGANPNPLHTTRNVTVCLYPTNVDPSGDTNCSRIPANLKATGTVTYDRSSGNFVNASFNMGTGVATGQYTVLAKVDNFLRKRIGNIQTLTSGQNTNLGNVVSLGGDIDGNNSVNVVDYNDLFSCYGPKFNSSSCQFQPSGNTTGADVNDDGKVDGVDYNLFIRSLAVQSGD